MPLLCLRMLSPAERLDEGYRVGCEWLVREDSGALRGQGVTDYRGIADLADPNQGWVTDPDNVLVLIPNEYALEVSANVPGRAPAQIRRALPYAVEEFIATDIDKMHVASGVIKSGEPVRCQVIERELLENWVGCLRSVGIEPGHFVTDAHLLPDVENGAAVLFDADTVLIRAPEQAATLDRGNLLLALQSLEIERVVQIRGAMDDLEAAQLDGVSVERSQDDADSSIGYLANNWSGRAEINLLQGDFKPPRRRTPISRGWQLVATLAAVWIGVAWLSMAVQAFWSERQSVAWEEEAKTRYQALFPDERNVRNPRRALERKLGQRSSTGEGNAFVQLTHDLATALPAEVRVKSLEYADQRGELKTELQAQGYSALEQVEQALAARGVDAELQNTVQDGDQVLAYFIVRAPS